MLRHSITAVASIALAAALAACSSAKTETAPAAETTAAAPTRAQMAMGYRSTGRRDAAIAAAQQAVRAQPADARSYATLASAFLGAKRQRGGAILLAYASDALAAAEALEPRSAKVLALRGVLLQEDHRFDELAELARTLIEIAPTDSTGHLLLGDAHLERGDYAAAAAAYEDAMAQYPDLRVYSRGAHMRWLHGDVEGAFEMFDAALESGGGNREHLAWCIVEVGEMLLGSGADKRVLLTADRAQELVPDYPPALALRARAEHARGNHDAAAAVIEAVIEARSSASDHFLRADIELARGNATAAAAAARDGLSLAKHDPLPAARFLARHNQDIAQALELTATEVRARPTIAAASTRALALYRAGRYDDAASQIERALRLGTPMAELHLSDALIRVARRDIEGARVARAKAMEINPNADRALMAELDGKLEVVR